MPKLAYRNCRRCHKTTDEVGVLSHSRLCHDCGMTLCAENLDGLISHSGPFFQAWRIALAASVGFGPLDAKASRSHSPD